MKLLTASVLLAVLPVGFRGTALSTESKAERALRMEIDTALKLETTTMEVEVDGEPREMSGGGMSTETRRKEIHVDHAVEVEDGKPKKVRRTFETAGGKTERTRGEDTQETDLESPLEGVTLEIVRKDGEVEVSAVEGGKPEGKALEGHLPELFLDAFLPEGEVETDAPWDLDSDAVRRALRLDVSQSLFPPPEREEEGGEEGGERRRGMRGMGRAGAGLLTDAEWKGKAKLVATDRDVDGIACAVIEIELEASGELPDPEFRGGGGGRAFSPALPALPALTTTYDISLEGKLFFAMKEKRPVSIDLEGTAKVESEREFTRGESSVRMHSIQEGTVTFRVAVTEESAKKEK